MLNTAPALCLACQTIDLLPESTPVSTLAHVGEQCECGECAGFVVLTSEPTGTRVDVLSLAECHATA